MAYGAILGQTAPPSEAGVTSFNGRTGEVVPQQGDYTAEQVGALSINGGTLNGVLNMGNNKITNVTPGTSSGNAVEFGQFNNVKQISGAILLDSYYKVYAQVFSDVRYLNNYTSFSCFIPIGFSNLSSKKTIFYLVVFSNATSLGPVFRYYYNNEFFLGSNYNVQIMYPKSGLTYNSSRGFVCSTPGYYIVAVEFNE